LNIKLLLRWIATFLAFPIAGFLAALALGPIRELLPAAVAGAMVGALLGLAQWWALRPIGVTFDWAWSTAVALMFASPIAWALIGYSSSVLALTTWGLIAGIIVGLSQALSQRLQVSKSLIWATLVSAAWGLAWFISANVIVDAESNYAIFGSTGAVVATAGLSLFLSPVLTRTK
jgi:hypothetical protein